MATVAWAALSGNWSLATNWSGGSVPVAGDDVILPASNVGYTVTLDAGASPTPALDSLTIGGATDTGNITLDVGAQTLNVNGTGGGATDTITMDETGASATITLEGGAINFTTLAFAGATQAVSGFGTLGTSGVSVFEGTGSITASGGVLSVDGTVNGGVVLAISSASASTLQIFGTATASTAIAISSANQTLEIGVGSTLSIAAAESITNGSIVLDSTSSELILPASALTIGTGATVSGMGTISAPGISGAGTIIAQGGPLVLAQNFGDATGLTLDIATASELNFNGTVGPGNIFTFLNNTGDSGTLAFGNDGGSPTETVQDMSVGAINTPTDVIDLLNAAGITISTSSGEGTANGSITLSDGIVLTLSNIGSTNWTPNVVSDGLTGTNIFLQVCFCRGTRLATDRGEAAVEELAVGDRVMTLSGAARPIKWVGRRAYDRRFVAGNRTVLPIRIEAGALGDGIPTRDLFVSPEHALYIDGGLVPARLLVNGMTIRQLESVDRLEYFHIELDTHDVILAEGAATESYLDCDNRGMFHNAGEFTALYADEETAKSEFCAPRVEEDSAELTAIRTALLDRAEALGRATRDPGLHLIADGEIVRAESGGDGIYRFSVAASRARGVALVSRSAVPAEVYPSSLDGRALGVPVDRIVLAGGGLRVELGHDCLALRDGFHDDEASHRWTDGRGCLPLELLGRFAGGLTVEVRLAPLALVYPSEPPTTVEVRHSPAGAASLRSSKVAQRLTLVG